MTNHTNLSAVPKVEANEMPEDIATVARRLGEEFATRAAAADEGDRFVSENYQALKASGLVEAGVPRELGGGGAEVAELCRHAAHPRPFLQLDRAGVLDAHPSGRHSGLALAPPEGRRRSSRC